MNVQYEKRYAYFPAVWGRGSDGLGGEGRTGNIIFCQLWDRDLDPNDVPSGSGVILEIDLLDAVRDAIDGLENPTIGRIEIGNNREYAIDIWASLKFATELLERAIWGMRHG